MCLLETLQLNEVHVVGFQTEGQTCGDVFCMQAQVYTITHIRVCLKVSTHWMRPGVISVMFYYRSSKGHCGFSLHSRSSVNICGIVNGPQITLSRIVLFSMVATHHLLAAYI